jgi:hypothetical protein
MMMRRKTVRIGFLVILAAWAASPGGPRPASGSTGQTAAGLDTVITDLPPRPLSVRELVETIGGRCGMRTVLGDRVTGEVSFERFPVTARELLETVLPARGCLYLVEGDVLRVMSEDSLRRYFHARAETRVYGAQLTPDLTARLLETPDLVSTLGYLGVDPVRSVVHIHDLPCYADRVERILVPGGVELEGVTL